MTGAGVTRPTVKAKALVFEDTASRELLRRIGQLAPSDATDLVIGETGTGRSGSTLISRPPTIGARTPRRRERATACGTDRGALAFGGARPERGYALRSHD